MDRDEVRRSSRAAALASLKNLAAAFAGDAGVVQTISDMIDTVGGFDVKPPAPAVGFVVIGEAMAVPQPPEHPREREPKRPRRQPAGQMVLRTLDDYPVGCEVLLPRTDNSGRRWNEYCKVVGHTIDGQLQLEVPDPAEDEAPLLQRSIFSLGSQLGNEETRPLRRPRGSG
eukprot:6516606-Prymnesium_polylepis.1